MNPPRTGDQTSPGKGTAQFLKFFQVPPAGGDGKGGAQRELLHEFAGLGKGSNGRILVGVHRGPEMEGRGKFFPQGAQRGHAFGEKDLAGV